MCGIAGFFAQEPQPPSTLRAMSDAIVHRGPDDGGWFGVSADGKSQVRKEWDSSSAVTVGLAFRRLAIIDLSPTGAQPMQTPDGRYTIVFNGEIYNYVELRKELSDVTFRGTSDTEVLLHLFARMQTDCFSKLNGIFGFAIYDAKEKKLWLARDHFGIKPIYYYRDNRGIFFGSEIRALLKSMPQRPRVRKDLLSRYLSSNWVCDPDTLFEGIYKLEPGHFLQIDSKGAVVDHCYWDLDYGRTSQVPLPVAVDELDHILDAAVERQLRSDVPVAFFLSGGVDSSLLAARAQKVQKEAPTTYTIGFNWSGNRQTKDFDLDLESASAISKQFGFNHQEIILNPSIVSLLPTVVETLEEPIADPAAICSYLICEAAAKKFKVLVSGQGGDELFGGYPVYQFAMLARSAHDMGEGLLGSLEQLSHLLPYELAGHRFHAVQRLRKLFNAAHYRWPEPFFHLRSAFSTEPVTDLLNADVAAHQVSPFGQHWNLFERTKNWDALHQLMYLDAKTYLPCLNLTYTDKTSMAHSVEVRVPLLDMEITQFMSRISWDAKIKGSKTKILLKKLAERTLPSSIIYRKKTGFGLPVREWLLKDLQPMARELLSPERLRKQGLLNPKAVETWLDEHQSQKADHSLKIYSLMTLQLWFEKFEVGI